MTRGVVENGADDFMKFERPHYRRCSAFARAVADKRACPADLSVGALAKLEVAERKRMAVPDLWR